MGAIIPFIPGKLEANNGDVVSYDGQCFIAQNNPGIWETPSADSWFWSLTECSGEPEPEVAELVILSPITGQLLNANEAIAIKARIDGELASKVGF